MTYVLVIIIFGSGITNVPGYATLGDCREAREDVVKMSYVQAARCIPGPWPK